MAKLVEEQKKICQAYLQEAKKLIKDGDEKTGGLALFGRDSTFPSMRIDAINKSRGGYIAASCNIMNSPLPLLKDCKIVFY